MDGRVLFLPLGGHYAGQHHRLLMALVEHPLLHFTKMLNRGDQHCLGEPRTLIIRLPLTAQRLPAAWP
jgi:hypothetical protein